MSRILLKSHFHFTSSLLASPLHTHVRAPLTPPVNIIDNPPPPPPTPFHHGLIHTHQPSSKMLDPHPSWVPTFCFPANICCWHTIFLQDKYFGHTHMRAYACALKLRLFALIFGATKVPWSGSKKESWIPSTFRFLWIYLKQHNEKLGLELDRFNIFSVSHCNSHGAFWTDSYPGEKSKSLELLIWCTVSKFSLFKMLMSVFKSRFLNIFLFLHTFT